MPTHGELSGDAALSADAADLRRTAVVATLDTPHDSRNLVWCSTMQLAWDRLMAIAGGPVRIRDCPLAGSLNDAHGAASDLDRESYVALAGWGRDGILESIKRDLLERFEGQASPGLLPAKVGDDELLAYAYLFKNLRFGAAFGRNVTELRFLETPVECFSPGGEGDVHAQRAQVQVLGYTSPQDFLVALQTQSTDRLLVARMEPAGTLEETVEIALAMAGEPGGVRAHEQFAMPVLDFDLRRSYPELERRVIENESIAPRTLLAALQSVRLRLDEHGALLKSEASMLVGLAMPRNLRRFVVDGPFLLMMLRPEAERPYLAVWVENDELLLARRADPS